MLEIGHSLLAELDIREGRPQEAHDRLVGLVPTEGANLPLLLPALSWAHLESGDPERALELASLAEGETRARQALLYLPEALRVKGMALARLDKVQDARAALSEGRVRAAAMPNPYTEARILVELGMLDRQEGHEERALEYLEEALAIFRRLGATSDVKSAERILSTSLSSGNR
jgi:tetratricopeptide (TPR) repeat protein